MELFEKKGGGEELSAGQICCIEKSFSGPASWRTEKEGGERGAAG